MDDAERMAAERDLVAFPESTIDRAAGIQGFVHGDNRGRRGETAANFLIYARNVKLVGHDGGVRGLNHAGKRALVVVVAVRKHDTVDCLAAQGLKDALGTIARVDDKAMRRIRVAHDPAIRFDGPYNNARHFQHGLVLPPGTPHCAPHIIMFCINISG